MQTEKERDAYYRRTYNITLAEYQERERQQDFKCAICGYQPGEGKRRLNVDHDHKVAKLKFKVERIANGFSTTVFDIGFTCSKRAELVKQVKRVLLRASIRALTCGFCNRGLTVYKNNSRALRKAADYLEQHQINSLTSSQAWFTMAESSNSQTAVSAVGETNDK